MKVRGKIKKQGRLFRSYFVDNIPIRVYIGTCKGLINPVDRKIELQSNSIDGFAVALKEGVFLKYDDQVQNRVKRIEGQLRGILRMMDEQKDCKEVITQLSATRSALDRTMGVVVSSNLVECVRMANVKGEEADEAVAEAVNLLVKSR